MDSFRDNRSWTFYDERSARGSASISSSFSKKDPFPLDTLLLGNNSFRSTVQSTKTLCALSDPLKSLSSKGVVDSFHQQHFRDFGFLEAPDDSPAFTRTDSEVEFRMFLLFIDGPIVGSRHVNINCNTPALVDVMVFSDVDLGKRKITMNRKGSVLLGIYLKFSLMKLSTTSLNVSSTAEVVNKMRDQRVFLNWAPSYGITLQDIDNLLNTNVVVSDLLKVLLKVLLKAYGEHTVGSFTLLAIRHRLEKKFADHILFRLMLSLYDGRSR